MSDTRNPGPPPGPRPGEHPPQRALAMPGVNRLSAEPLRQVKTLDSLFSNAEFRQRIGESVPKHVTPDRMLRTMVTAVQKAPLLAKADIRGLIGAFLTCSQCGLEPNTPMQHMHLIPFRKSKWNPQTRQREEVGVEVQIIFGYQGLLELSYRSPLVTSISANVVMGGDDFSFEYGTDAHLRHRPKGGGARGAQPTYAYMMAKLKDGFAFEVMPWADVLAIRNQSQGFRQALAAKEEAESKGRKLPATWTEAPWVKHDVAMGRKTAFRAGSKWLPRSVEMANVLAIDEAQERRRNIDWGTVIDAGDGDYVSAAATAAEVSGEEGDGDGYGPIQEQGDDQGAPAQQQQGAQAQQQQPSTQPRQEPRQQEREPQQEQQTTRVFGGTAFDSGPGSIPGDPGPTDDRGAPPEDTKPKATRPKPPELPEFSAGVLDAYGGDLDGEIHTTRLGWANGYATAWAGCDGVAMTEALADFNADALADARQDKKAGKVLDNLTLPTARMIREAEAEKAAAEQKARDDDAARAAAAAAKAPPPADDGPAAAEEGEPDTDHIWAVALCGDAEKASLSDVNAMIAHKGIQERMRVFQTARPDLFQMVEKAFQARLARKG